MYICQSCVQSPNSGGATKSAIRLVSCLYKARAAPRKRHDWLPKAKIGLPRRAHHFKSPSRIHKHARHQKRPPPNSRVWPVVRTNECAQWDSPVAVICLAARPSFRSGACQSKRAACARIYHALDFDKMNARLNELDGVIACWRTRVSLASGGI